MGKGKHLEKKEDLEKEGDMEREDSFTPRPPDGGWGWAIVFSSFFIHVIADGIVYSFGVFFVEFLDYFGGGKGETAWIGSLVPAVTYTVGPIASALTNRYGCRIVTIAGSFIATAGFILSLFAPDIYYMYLTFGIMAGLGFGLIYLPAIVSVANYFEKRRSFATGLAVCGSGFGTFIFAPLSKWLLDIYGWKGAILIEAGLILNIVVCGALFRPLVQSKSDKLLQKLEQETKDILAEGEGTTLSKTYGSKTDTKDESEALIHSEPPEESSVPQERLKPPSVDREILRFCSSNRDFLHSSDSPSLNNATAELAHSDGALHQVKNEQTASPRTLLNVLDPSAHQRQTSHGSHAGPLYRKDIFYSASLQNIPMYRSNPNVYITSITSISEGASDWSGNWKMCRFLKPSKEFRDAIGHMLQFSLLKDVVFLMFSISNFFTSIGFNMPFIYLPDRAIDSGVEPHKAAFLLSVIGIANTAGRVLFGWLSDRHGVNRLMLYNSALTICGVATLLSPFCGGNYPLLVVYAAFFGMFIGVYVSLTSIVLVDLLGLDHLTNSFGLLLLFQGAATFIGPPMAGWMYDWTGSYDISFHVNGSMIAISGIMLYFIPLAQKYQRGKKPVSCRDIDLGKHVSEADAKDIALATLRERTVSV